MSDTLLPVERGRILFGQPVRDLSSGQSVSGRKRLQTTQQFLLPLDAGNIWNREIATYQVARAAK